MEQLKQLSKEDIRQFYMTLPRFDTDKGVELTEAFVRKAEQEMKRQIDERLTILIREVTLKTDSKVGALLAAQTRALRQELKQEGSE